MSARRSLLAGVPLAALVLIALGGAAAGRDARCPRHSVALPHRLGCVPRAVIAHGSSLGSRPRRERAGSLT